VTPLLSCLSFLQSRYHPVSFEAVLLGASELEIIFFSLLPLGSIAELNRLARRGGGEDDGVIHLLGTWNIVAKDVIPIMKSSESDVDVLRACG